MFDRVLAVTNRKLCQGDFLTQVERIAAAHPRGLVLREKDLSEADYQALAAQVLPVCAAHGVPCMLHRFDRVARALGCTRIHLPLPYLTAHPEAAAGFGVVGVSVHSVSEAEQAVRCGATYLTAGHVFPTDCKKACLHAVWISCVRSAALSPSRSMLSAASRQRTQPAACLPAPPVSRSCLAL